MLRVPVKQLRKSLTKLKLVSSSIFKLLTFSLSIYLALVLFSEAESAESTDKNKIDLLKEQIEFKQSDLKKSRRKQKKIYRELKKSEKAISNTNRRINEISKKRLEILSELAGLEKKSILIKKKIEKERKTLEKYFYHLYVNERRGSTPLKILLRSQDAAKTLRQIRYLAYISNSRKDLIWSLENNLDELKTITEHKKNNEAKLSKTKRTEAIQKKKLVKEKSKKDKILSKVKGHIKRTIRAIKKDEKLLDRKIRELARVTRKQKAKTGLNNTKLPDRSFDGKSFRKLKGKLRLPILGRLQHRYGSRREGDIVWKGVFISAESGQMVRAIASGEVVYADWLGGFGNLLIIDHGGGYLSLYGNNEGLLKNPGDIVKAGDEIGIVGNTGGNRNSGLYLELRFKGKPFNPMKWVKL